MPLGELFGASMGDVVPCALLVCCRAPQRPGRVVAVCFAEHLGPLLLHVVAEILFLVVGGHETIPL